MSLNRTGVFCSLALALLGLVPPCVAQAPKLHGYEPLANPDITLAGALAEAKASQKKVLIIAGGDWCTWCHALEAFITRNPDVRAELDRSFVTIKVYVGEENSNRAFFSRMPPAKGHPHFWVLSSDGQHTQSVNTLPLENGKDSYDKPRFLMFIRNERERPDKD